MLLVADATVPGAIRTLYSNQLRRRKKYDVDRRPVVGSVLELISLREAAELRQLATADVLLVQFGTTSRVLLVDCRYVSLLTR